MLLNSENYVDKALRALDKIISNIYDERSGGSVQCAFGDLLQKLNLMENKNTAPDQQNS